MPTDFGRSRAKSSESVVEFVFRRSIGWSVGNQYFSIGSEGKDSNRRRKKFPIELRPISVGAGWSRESGEIARADVRVEPY